MKGRKLVAWNLRRIRVQRDLSQDRLALDADVDRSYVGRVRARTGEPNRRHPRPPCQGSLHPHQRAVRGARAGRTNPEAAPGRAKAKQIGEFSQEIDALRSLSARGDSNLWGKRLTETQARPMNLCIPRSRHDPKILWVDDAEIVGDRITKVRPIPRNLFTQKTERRIGELGTSCVALVVSDVSVHEAP